MNLKGKKIRLHDVSLRDGMHSIHHQFTLQNMQTLSLALDQAKVIPFLINHDPSDFRPFSLAQARD